MDVCSVGIVHWCDRFAEVGRGDPALALLIPVRHVSLSNGSESNLTDGLRVKTAHSPAIAAAIVDGPDVDGGD